MTEHERGKILVVDDTEANRYTSVRILKTGGYQLFEAATGSEGLTLAKSLQPDLIVLDVKLPDMTGFDVSRQLRANPHTAAISVLHISASYSSPSAHAHGLDVGADGYLTHPVEPPVLLATVNALLRARRAERKLQGLLEEEQAARQRAETLARDNERLYEQAQRAIRSRDDLLATVSHDLKNPLGVILMAVDRFGPNPHDEERRGFGTRQIAAIKRAAHRMDHLIRDLLDSASIEAGKFAIERTPHAAKDLLSEASEMMAQLAAGRTLQLETKPIQTSVVVYCDRDRVLQVFSNLIGNALKFTPDGGMVRVMAAAGADEVEFSIEDTGCGISDAQLTHIFERYWKVTQPNREGTGLGLFISKGIIEAHDGKIWAESRPRQGTRFAFTLPLVGSP